MINKNYWWKGNKRKALNKFASSGYKVSTGDPYGDYFLQRSVQDIMAEYSEQKMVN